MSGAHGRERAAGGPPLLSVRGLSKRFPGVLANDSISFDVFPGEVHALLGENGAGKSTLVKCIYGYHQRDAGEILVDGVPVDLHSPQAARQHRIGMVFQNLTLIPALSVVENVALFLPDLPRVPNLPSIARELDALGERYRLQVDPWAQVQDLSIGQQQKAELLKLLLGRSRLLILDEPTRVLAPHEIEGLFQVVKHLVDDGLAVVLITHKLQEVLQAADRITVLRRGRVAGQLSRSEATEDGLVRLMFDKEIAEVSVDREPASAPAGPPILELRAAETPRDGATICLEQIDLTIHPGEIVGVAGVSGNGQRELGDLILGDLPCARGGKWLLGKDVTRAPVSHLRLAGVSFIPENPLTMAIVPFLTVLENMALTRLGRYARRGGLALDWQAVRADIERAMHALGFSFPLFALARSLSGGNQQRMVITRELSADPRLVVASYLTRGLDVQSTIAARQAMIQARQRGAGVLLISEDLEELFRLSDRLVVMYGGRIVGRFKPEETDIYTVGRLMTGAQGDHGTRV
ncbi:MAG: ABC transporter ATP-binding protein [Anaerolineales bacterium]|nr:ABC transporter ATP-binding protein [Anaerolineales bacterium]